LAPNLNKLNVSHNKLIQIGPIENYPASLKWLDLSNNAIRSDGAFECDSAGDLEPIFIMGQVLLLVERTLATSSLIISKPNQRPRKGLKVPFPRFGNQRVIGLKTVLGLPLESHRAWFF